jgi:hypothetical protein
MSTYRATEKQKACKHPTTRTVVYPRGVGVYCETCQLRFTPYPELVAARRRAKQADVELTNARARIAAGRSGELAAQNAVVIERDQTRRELKQANEEISRRQSELAIAKSETIAVRALRDAAVAKRVRDTGVLRELLDRAIDLVVA